MRGVIFDLDGVLIDSVKLHCRSYILAMQELGIKPDVQKIKELMGEKAEVIIEKSSDRPLPREEIEELVRRKTYWYQRELKREKPIKPGARELLEFCVKSGLKLGLATGTRRENVELFLEILGFNPFSAIVSANDVSRAKPDPEIWQKTLAKLGLKAPEALAIDDSVLGVISAKKAGLKVIGVLGTFPKERLKESGADWIAKDLWEVKRIIGDLLNNDYRITMK